MLKNLKKISLLLSLSLTLAPQTTLQAAEFNPNFIISDEELQDWDSMGRGEIKSFLLGKGGFIANLVSPDVNGKNRRVIDIIFNAAQEHKINPKYLLVKLQKEMSLVTEQNPTERQLDYATGYGVCDSCSFSDPAVTKHKGFGTQVDSAAGIMRWYYDHVNEEPWIKKAGQSYSIDNTEIKPANLATAFLYTYTPHLLGNKNFWTLWQSWFDQVYPNGTLFKAENNPDVYYLQEGKKRKIQSMSVLLSRFDPKTIVEIPESELGRYETGLPLHFPNYSVFKEGNSYYLLDFDELRPFENYEVVRKLGYNPGEIEEVKAEDLSGYQIGSTIKLEENDPMGKLLKVKENGAFYYIKNGIYHPLSDAKIAKARFPQLSFELGSIADLKGLSEGPDLGFPDGTLMGDILTKRIYVIEKNKKRHITDQYVFKQLGYNWEAVVWVDTITADAHDIGEPLYLRQESESKNTTVQQALAKPAATPLKNTALESEQDTQSPGKGVLYFSSKNSTKLPIAFPETGKMIATPEEETTFTGASTFSTEMDAYLVAEYPSGKILASKNADTIRPMASFTKVMTAYLLFEKNLKLNGISTYDAAKHKALYHAYRISQGEAVRNRDLMKAMLVSSRNTPARMLAQSVEADEKVFISSMNELAELWGLEKTHFSDSSGYDLGNQSSISEYLRIFMKGLEKPEIKEFMSIKEYEYHEVIDKDGQTRHADYNTNRLMQRSDLSFNILASKTGYLYESGYNMAMLVERKSDGKMFLSITMGNPDYARKFSEPERFTTWALNTL